MRPFALLPGTPADCGARSERWRRAALRRTAYAGAELILAGRSRCRRRRAARPCGRTLGQSRRRHGRQVPASGARPGPRRGRLPARCSSCSVDMGYRDGAEDVRRFRAAVLDGRVNVRPSLLLRAAFAGARVVSDPELATSKLAKAVGGPTARGSRRLARPRASWLSRRVCGVNASIQGRCMPSQGRQGNRGGRSEASTYSDRPLRKAVDTRG